MPARLPFYALMGFTFIVLVAPQALFPALAPLHLALITGAVAGGAHIANRLARSRPLTVLEPEVRLALLLVGFGVLSVPTSFWPGGSVSTLVDLLGKSLIAFLLIANIVVTAERLRAMFWLLALGSTVPALSVIKSYFDGRLTLGRVEGFGGVLTSNPNDVALTLNIVIPLALGLALASRRWRSRLALAAVIGVAVAGVAVTLSRAGFIFLATTVFLSLTRLKHGRVWAVLVLALLVPLMMSIQGFTDRMVTITDVQTDASAQERWQTIKNALVLMMEHPVFGVGIGQSIVALNEIGGPRWRHVHNVYLEVGVDLGIPALVVYVLLLCRAIQSVRAAKRAWAARESDLHHLAQGLEISLIGFAVAAMFYPIAYHFFFYYLIGLAVAVRVLARQAALAEPEPVRGGPSPALAVPR